MRLVSKLHDFYDGVIRSTASDKTHTFVRETREIETDVNSTYFLSASFRTAKKDVEVRGEFVGFCGKVYPCLRIETTPLTDSFCY